MDVVKRSRQKFEEFGPETNLHCSNGLQISVVRSHNSYRKRKVKKWLSEISSTRVAGNSAFLTLPLVAKPKSQRSYRPGDTVTSRCAVDKNLVSRLQYFQSFRTCAKRSCIVFRNRIFCSQKQNKRGNLFVPNK